MGLQQDYTLTANTPGPTGSTAGVPPGQTTEIVVRAVNNGLQRVASGPVVMAVLLAKASEPKQSAAAAERPVVNGITNKNSNGNGHHELARRS